MMSTTLRLTIDQYEQMIARDAFANLHKRIEFIDGELLQMSPAGPVMTTTFATCLVGLNLRNFQFHTVKWEFG